MVQMKQRKQCKMCSKTKDRKDFHNSKTTKDGLSVYCRPCKYEANKTSNRKLMSENRLAFLEQRKNWHLREKYGITLDEYKKLLNDQNGVCAICRKECSRMLAVDHCHKTKVVRGLLCQRCNQGVGMFDDEPQRLIKAAEYLKY